ncbi:cbb3-type cytochrome c oxidase subunit I [Streptomyces capoamus]|uniref:cbb3-type cytochrome c oxidase subunit I n=1 Tax=Streptomyces capoamus TaxID=68183 RepID=UPI003C2D9A12
MTLAPHTEPQRDDAGRPVPPGSWLGWISTTDHKRIGLLTVGTALVLLLVDGVFALLLRAQLAQPEEGFLSPHLYDQLFTMHGSGMIYTVMTPFAIGMGVYLVPLQIGAPGIALPWLTLLGHWLYVLGALTMPAGFSWACCRSASRPRRSPGRG